MVRKASCTRQRVQTSQETHLPHACQTNLVSAHCYRHILNISSMSRLITWCKTQRSGSKRFLALLGSVCSRLSLCFLCSLHVSAHVPVIHYMDSYSLTCRDLYFLAFPVSSIFPSSWFARVLTCQEITWCQPQSNWIWETYQDWSHQPIRRSKISF